MQRSPFKRIITLMQALAAAVAAGMPHRLALEQVGEYRSRGKGLGRHSGKKWGPPPSGKYDGVTNGRRECERRMRQMDRDAANQARRAPALDERFAIEA